MVYATVKGSTETKIYPPEFLFHLNYSLIYSYFRVTAAILNFRPNLLLRSHGIYGIDIGTPENMGIGVGISFLSIIEPEIPWGVPPPRLPLTYVEKKVT